MPVPQAGVLWGHPGPSGHGCGRAGTAEPAWNFRTPERRVIFSLVERVPCLRRDPCEYLEWFFGRLPGMTKQDDFEPMLPCSWAAAQQAAENEAEEAE